MRNCNGGNGRLAQWCGRPATVVVSARLEYASDRALQWFACDEPSHHAYEDAGGRVVATTTEPLGAWLARNGLE